MLSAAVAILIVIALLCCAIAAYAIALGPGNADRVVALEILFSAGLALAIAASIQAKSSAFIDVALGLAIVGFIATLGWARLLDRSADSSRSMANKEKGE